ncbi:MAG: hypothetical protein Q7Q73_12650 [Verrucomicrobiota bacterium JB024]|nr:hypothetical protein [Verrucomicrobiota bacterium JB024]
MKKYPIALCFICACAASFAGTVHVSSFNAYPDDGIDDTAAINAAITSGHYNTVVFDAGVYDLITPTDAGAFIQIYNRTGITLQGATTAMGKPATVLLRHVNVEAMASPPRTLHVYDGADIALQNLAIDNTPQLCSAGEIIDKTDDGNGTQGIKVAVLPGLPMDAGMPCYAANAWDPVSLDLKEGIQSLTFTVSPGDWSIADSVNRVMELSSTSGLDFYDDIEVGDYMSWHYGWDGLPQMFLYGTDGLTLDNLEVRNVVNVGILIGAAADITLTDIVFRPDGNQLAVGPRDGIYISRSTGAIAASGLDITGVRWDGFVVRSAYAEVTAVNAPASLTLAVEINTSGQPITSGSSIYFLATDGSLTERTVGSAAFVQTLNGKSTYEVTLTDDLPTFANVGIHLKLGALMPDFVSVVDSNFENIAGASVILRADNITVQNTTHRKVMYEAMHIGTHPLEGVDGSNIKVLNSTFDTCGWYQKVGHLPGIITIFNNHAQVTEGKIHGVEIKYNLFRNQLCGAAMPSLNIADAEGLTIHGNVFENVTKGMQFDLSSAGNFGVGASTIIIDNSDNDVTYREVSGTFANSGLTGYNGSSTRYAWWTGAKAEWTFIAPKSSQYEVYVYAVEHPTSSDSVVITVGNDATAVQHTLDFTSDGGWRYLGTYSYTGQVAYTVSAEAQNAHLRTDAVMFVQR